MAFEAYYQNRSMMANHHLGKKMSEMTSLPLEAKAIGRRLMTPLQLDWKKLATLDRTEQSHEIAKYLTREAVKQEGIAGASNPAVTYYDLVEKLPTELIVDPEDVIINFPGSDVWRQVKPNARRIVAPWNSGERQYYQIEAPLLYEFFARTKKPIKALVGFSRMMKPWKRGITHTWPFVAWNILSRDPSTAMLLGSGKDTYLPWLTTGKAIINRITKRQPAAQSQTELLAKALDSTSQKAHQSVVQKFLCVLGEGIVIPHWRTQNNVERLMEVPGIVMSAALKPVDILNYVTLARSTSEFTEGLTREGAFISAKERGLSDE